MICPKCKQNNEENARFCANCGAEMMPETPASSGPSGNAAPVQPTAQGTAGNTEGGKPWVLPVVIASSALALVLVAIICTTIIVRSLKAVNTAPVVESAEAVQEQIPEENPGDVKPSDEENNDVKSSENENPISAEEAARLLSTVKSIERPAIVEDMADEYCDSSLVPSVPSYTVSADFSEISDKRDIEYLPDSAKEKLAKNLFVIMDEAGYEFYDIYEWNRYDMKPNFVTVDSMMHTYHVYFAYLLKKLEREELSEKLKDITGDMYEASVEQYEELKGSEWEEAALRNVEFFGVAAELLDVDVDILSDAKGTVNDELALIETGSVDVSPLLGDFEDYSQYKPRGYYEGDENLEKYFRAMMWYGRRAFEQREESHMRSALLMTLALDKGSLDDWEGIYTITSFFAGASDDNTYYEMKPLIDAAYGGRIEDVKELTGNADSFALFMEGVKALEPPKVNSIPVFEDDEEKVITSFRFMGQRFSIDATIFQNLIYSKVDENSQGDKRMLPDALDVPAVLGSQTAYDILDAQGATDYKGYTDNLKAMQDELAGDNSSELWRASLYSQWLHTLRPLLTAKGEGYPSFMQSEEWSKKSLEGFLGSYAELKHDTILYSKQAMAEMGGGWDEEFDDRGYVEPEPVVYSRFVALAENTANGLKEYGMLSKDDKDNLMKLAEIARQLITISEKELRNETLSDAEYDFIREYGGDLEHIWADAVKEPDEDYAREDEHPGAIIADVATDPNGSVLEIGTGQVGKIYAICPVAGSLRVCSGAVYSFYEFPWSIDDRLTDREWRIKLGIWPEHDYEYNKDKSIVQPEWTGSYRAHYEWNY